MGERSTTAALWFWTLYGNYVQSRRPGSTIVVEDVSKPGYTSTHARSDQQRPRPKPIVPM